MDKLQMAHDYALKLMGRSSISIDEVVRLSFDLADAMQAEADERNKAEAEQKRKEMREMLNSPNTFVEREGQHFDDVNWQPDWSQAPGWAKWWAVDSDGKGYFFVDKPKIGTAIWMLTGSCVTGKAPSFGYTGNWQDSMRERPHGF